VDKDAISLYFVTNDKTGVFCLRLKQLEIQGFKSFADKVNLEFDLGITSIVGPNGSGKSNIADAIRWALGEQSSKTLRGSKMEDIIFAGTEHRKAMGFAEVSLTIDNNDKSLPIEYSEVKITRRLYRSGESEYYINKTQCRLKDINELFLDTGIGKEGYSVIGQNRIDEILSTKSEDRRFIFEEASGIMKYKLRKNESEKKLENTRQNLLRIKDIINELEAQLIPLKEQSEVAKKYLNLRETLKSLEVSVYLINIEKLKERINEFQNLRVSAEQSIEETNNKIEELNCQNDTRASLIKARAEKLNCARNEYFELEKYIEKYNAEIKLNQEKISNYEKNIDRLDNEIKQINAKLSKLSEDQNLRDVKLKQLNEQFNINEKFMIELEYELKTLLNTLGQDEKQIEEMKSSVMERLEFLADKKTQVNDLDNQIKSVSERKNRIQVEVSQIDDEFKNEDVRREEVYAELELTKKAITNNESKIQAFNKEIKENTEKLTALRNKQSKLKSEKQFKESRYQMLKNMETNLEGYNRSVRVVLKKCRESSQFGANIHGALAQLIEVDEKYETAIEMTLGGALQNIVTTTEEDAKHAIEFLKTNHMGRATFLPISSVTGSRLAEGIISRISKYKGFCGIASDLVKCDSNYKGIILSFLGKVVVVDNIDTGIRMAKDFKYNFRIATLDGDILSTRGSITGGESSAKGSGILGRNREISVLFEQVLQLTKDEMFIEERIESMIDTLNRIDAALKLKNDKLQENLIHKARNENYLSQINDNINRMKSKSEMLEQESKQLSREVEQISLEREKYIKEQSDLENKIDDIKGLISEASDKHRDNQIARDKLNEKLTSCKVTASTIWESMEGIKDNILRLTEEKSNFIENINTKNSEKHNSTEQINSLAQKNEGLLKLIKRAEDDKIGKTLEIDSIEEERRGMEEDLTEISRQIKDFSNNVMLMKEEYSRIEVKSAKAESELEAIQNRLWDEYELTYNNALSLRKDIGSMTQAQKSINEYRNEIKELGIVNVGAIDDYIKTKERYEFMTTQSNDMVNAEEKLQKVIAEITVLMKKQFLERFNQINENFNIVYKQLFEGGRAELRLTDEGNVLESGIDIEVQPPGKKLQNMLLLSGGERAFTAIALLFAILRLKPVPFCVLDEIEAALDDANVYRFAEYLKQYSCDTQFIMVTHRKGTMEASDSLYGITMQERGISGIVSLKLSEKAS